MIRRELIDGEISVPDVVLRSPANWTAILFLSGLGGLHLFMATHAYLHGHWEGFLSIGFGLIFVTAAVAAGFVRCEMAVFREQREVRLRTGFKRLRFERKLAFDQVRSVRLTLLNHRRVSDSTIEIVCEGEVIECPPTSVPRQEALCLAMLMDVRLIKVYGRDFPDVSERVDKLTSGGV
jgi:hypothetical protein